MTPIHATLHHLGSGIFRLDCAQLGLSATGRAPSPSLCRRIIKARPDLAAHTLECSLPCGMVCYTVMHVGRHAKSAYRTAVAVKPIVAMFTAGAPLYAPARYMRRNNNLT